MLDQQPLSEDDRRRLVALLDPGLADGPEMAAIAGQIDGLADQAECDQARELGQALAVLWGRALGGSWVYHPRFEELALEPLQRLAATCGTEHAHEVVLATEATELTWRALSATVAEPTG